MGQKLFAQAEIYQNLPIGSGVTEAACKTIVKERMCKSGLRWIESGAEIILNLRYMNKTEGKWSHFWSKIDRYGFERCAAFTIEMKRTINPGLKKEERNSETKITDFQIA